jgi:hypothetical protein
MSRDTYSATNSQPEGGLSFITTDARDVQHLHISPAAYPAAQADVRDNDRAFREAGTKRLNPGGDVRLACQLTAISWVAAADFSRFLTRGLCMVPAVSIVRENITNPATSKGDALKHRQALQVIRRKSKALFCVLEIPADSFPLSELKACLAPGEDCASSGKPLGSYIRSRQGVLPDRVKRPDGQILPIKGLTALAIAGCILGERDALDNARFIVKADCIQVTKQSFSHLFNISKKGLTLQEKDAAIGMEAHINLGSIALYINKLSDTQLDEILQVLHQAACLLDEPQALGRFFHQGRIGEEGSPYLGLADKKLPFVSPWVDHMVNMIGHKKERITLLRNQILVLRYPDLSPEHPPIVITTRINPNIQKMVVMRLITPEQLQGISTHSAENLCIPFLQQMIFGRYMRVNQVLKLNHNERTVLCMPIVQDAIQTIIELSSSAEKQAVVDSFSIDEPMQSIALKYLNRLLISATMQPMERIHRVDYEDIAQLRPKGSKPAGSELGYIYEKDGKTYLVKFPCPTLTCQDPDRSSIRTLTKEGTQTSVGLEIAAGDLFNYLSPQAYYTSKQRQGMMVPDIAQFGDMHREMLGIMIDNIYNGKPHLPKKLPIILSGMVRGYENLEALKTCVVSIEGDEHILSFTDCLDRGVIPEMLQLEGERRIPILGLMELLAAATVLADVDVLGGSAKNAGFVFEHDEDHTPIAVRVVKIDPGYSFHYYEGNNKTSQGPTPTNPKDIQFASSRARIQWVGLTIKQQQLFISSLKVAINKLDDARVFSEFLQRKNGRSENRLFVSDALCNHMNTERLKYTAILRSDKVYGNELATAAAAPADITAPYQPKRYNCAKPFDTGPAQPAAAAAAGGGGGGAAVDNRPRYRSHILAADHFRPKHGHDEHIAADGGGGGAPAESKGHGR